MERIKLNIEGLDEIETRDRVIDQLESLNGVRNVAISREDSCLEVTYEEPTSVAEINSHLQNNGYKVNK